MWFVYALFDKWGVWENLEDAASQSAFEFIFDLFHCRWCLMFWMSFVPTILLFSFAKYELIYLLTPFAIAGPNYLILKLISDDR